MKVVPHAPRSVGDVMATDPIVVRVDSGLAEAARLLEAHGISGMPVLDAAGAVVGVLSESDLLRARASDRLWASWATLRVKHLMTTPALVIRPDAPLTAAARMMERHHVSRLVVVAEGDPHRPVGIVAISDLLRAMADGDDVAPPAEASGTAEPPPAPVPDLDPDAPEERGD